MVAFKGYGTALKPCWEPIVIATSDGSACHLPDRFFYCGKAAKSEKNQGCDHLFWKQGTKGFIRVTKDEWEALPAGARMQGNVHPTVKPLTLMGYLCNLLGANQGPLLDPFCGSGSTLLAGLQNGVPDIVGFDSGPESSEIASARVLRLLPWKGDTSWGGFPCRVWGGNVAS